MGKPSQTSAMLMVRVGRINSSWENTYKGLNLSSADTVIPRGATNTDLTDPFEVGSGYNVTVGSVYIVSASGTRTLANPQVSQNIANLDGDLADCFRFFEWTGLTAGDKVEGTVSVDTGAAYGTSVEFVCKTLPAGGIKKGYGSCLANQWGTDSWPDEGDNGTWFKPVR